ncbi:MAG: hypothetical protein U9N56_02060 [Actinomycetota bacterium]|nr:hypothetical protein [Actinomycetota bacterium]
MPDLEARKRSTALGFLGDIRRNAGDRTAAARYYGESMRIWQKLDNNLGVAVSLDRLALPPIDAGHLPEAARLTGVVDRVISDGKITLPSPYYWELHAEAMELVEADDRGETLDEVLPFALELAEAIGAEAQT